MANEVRTGVKNVLPEKVIDYTHSECHIGKMNFANASFVGVANGNSCNVVICVSTSKEAHMRYSLASNGPSWFYFYEGAIPASNSMGTLRVATCMNRNFTTSAGTVFYAATNNMLGGTTGTLLVRQYIVGDTGGGAGTNTRLSLGSQAGNDIEWILKPNTNYLVSVINTAGVVRDFNVETEFYEEG